AHFFIVANRNDARTRHLRKKAIHRKGWFRNEYGIARLDEDLHEQAQRVIHAIGKQHFRRPHAKIRRQAAKRVLILGIHGQLLGRDFPQRAHHGGRTADGVLVEIEPQLALAPFFRRFVIANALNRRTETYFQRRRPARGPCPPGRRWAHWRTSTARRCATSPSASARAATTGPRLRKPAAETGARRIVLLSASDRFAGFVSGKRLSCPATASRTAVANLRDVVTNSAKASGSCSACARRSAAM